MFETTLTTSDGRALKVLSLPIATLLHLGAGLLLVAASCVTLEQMRDPELPVDVELWLTAAPPAPPSAPPAPARQPAAVPLPPREPGELTQPTEVPEILPLAPEPGQEEPEPTVTGAASDGVPGGVEIGVPGSLGPGGGSILGPGAAGSAALPASDEPLAITGNVRAPVLVQRSVPEYPRAASITRTQGRVVLRAVIDETGAVEQLTVVEGHPLLAAAAERAVGAWRYRPATLDGRAVRVWLEVTVHFQLN